MKSFKTLIASKRLIHASIGEVVRCQSLTSLMTSHVKLRIRGIKETLCLAQKLLQNFLETTYHSPLGAQKAEGVVFIP